MERKENSSEVSTSGRKESSVVKSKRQRREDMAKAAGVKDEAKGPKRCKEAIDTGLALFQGKQYAEAIAMFNLALELPGNGAYRLASSPREYSCPSDAEEQACLYNMACAYTAMGQKAAALTCLEGAMEAGFDDYATLRADPDLAALGGADIEAVVAKFSGPVAAARGVFGAVSGLLGGRREVVADPNAKKPWIVW